MKKTKETRRWNHYRRVFLYPFQQTFIRYSYNSEALTSPVLYFVRI